MPVAREREQDSGEIVSLLHEERDKKQVAVEELEQEKDLQDRREA